jgi:phosphoenolpyruvate carboxylase
VGAKQETREVLDTCKVIAEAPRGSIAAYVISMAKTPSDVLAVHLLLKEAGIGFALPVAPLFETLDDLNNANDVMTQLLNIDWYRGFIQGKQMVMIGYSDSAKAGVMAASWAQYQAQDALIKTCEKAGIELTLFHGRGGSIGRGGAPAHAALLSQPPGSLKGGLRVTEQGEMIRFKYGLPEVTISSLSLYTSAILEANLLPPPEPKANGATSWPSCPTSPARCIAATCVKTKISSLTSAPRRRSRSWVNCRWVRVRQNVADRRRRVAARHSVDLRLDAEPPDAAGLAGRWRRAAESGRRWQTE